MRRGLLRSMAEILPEPNTFIGGVGGAYITSAADFVSKSTGLVVSDIENFQIDGNNNVSFFVGAFYEMNQEVFRDRTDLTYFIDLTNGFASFTSFNFYNCANLKYIYTPNSDFSSSRYFNILGALKKLNMQSTLNLAGRFKMLNLPIKKLYLSSATNFNETNLTFVSCVNFTGLERLYLSSLTSFLNNSLIHSYIGEIFQNLKLNCKVYYNSSLGVQNRVAFGQLIFNNTQVGDEFTIDGRVYVGVAGTPVTDGEFTIGNNAQTAVNFRDALLADTRAGASDFTYFTNSLTYVLIRSIGTGAIWNVPTTSNIANTGSTAFTNPTLVGGNDVHQMLIYLRDKRSANIIQLSAPILVNPPTSLSYSNQTANTVDLNFTEPTPNANGNDGYEVWVDDGTVFRKWFEYAEILATGNTLDLAEVVADVGSIIGTKIKIRTIDGQMNFSEFSNEITIT